MPENQGCFPPVATWQKEKSIQSYNDTLIVVCKNCVFMVEISVARDATHGCVLSFQNTALLVLHVTDHCMSGAKFNTSSGCSTKSESTPRHCVRVAKVMD